MSFAILGMGTALPANSITQQEAVQVARVICCRTEDQAALLPSLYRHTEIQTRHLIFNQTVVKDVLTGATQSQSVFLPSAASDGAGPSTRQRMDCYRQEARPLALRASGQALEKAMVEAAEITHLVTISCTGFAAPGFDIGLINDLGLPATVQRTHVGFMGCHGALNGLRVAHAFTGADSRARVLVCALELCSLHYFYGWNPKKIVTNALFADGAAAVVGASAEMSSANAWQVFATGSCLFPDSEQAMTWTIGDHGFEMTLSTRVPALIGSHLRPWLSRWLRSFNLDVGHIATWAVHPGGPRILTAVEQALELPREACAITREVFTRCGNMSSPTLLFILDRLQQCRAPRPCVALGFGPGLMAEAVLLT